MMLAVGVDMIEVARIERGMARHGERFLHRFFTAQEVAYCEGSAARLAGRFAVKEAVGKALGTGIGQILKLCVTNAAVHSLCCMSGRSVWQPSKD